ncbi:MAG: hypothetical protein AAF004_01375 [Pseudomonadota bacterium]
MPNSAKTLWTVFALLFCGLALSGVADDVSDEYAASALERAFVTWAAARGLNSVISVAQGTEIALEPGGVGVNLTVGQALDPVNDLVEQFSSVMLIATSAIGLQNILLRITGTEGVTWFLCLSAVAALLALWVPALSAKVRLRAFVLRFLLITFVVRFALPFLVIGSNVVFDVFLAEQQLAATDALESTSEDIRTITEEQDAQQPDESAGLLSRFSDFVGDSIAALDVRERLSNLQDRVSGASEHIVNLIVIFVLQTILLPLMFLWLLTEGIKALAARATRIQ